MGIPAAAATAFMSMYGLRTARRGGKQTEFLADFFPLALGTPEGFGLVHRSCKMFEFVPAGLARVFVNRHINLQSQ